MKVAVTGASGHIGSNLCRMLIDRGYQVKALLHNDSKGLAGLPLEIIIGDVTCESDLEELCLDCEVLFHLAAVISLRKKDSFCEKINVDSCNRIIAAAKKTGVKKIIHFSSIHAFHEKPLESELNESRDLTLESNVSYNRSKALGQKMMTEASSPMLEIVALNPTAVIGPNDFKPSFLGAAIIRFYLGQIPGLVPGGYDWVDVRDVCSAAINAIDAGVAGECYLLGGSWQSLNTLTHEIEKNGGHKPPRINLPLWLAEIGAPFLNLHSKIRKKPPLYTSMSLHTLKDSHHNISCEKAKLALRYNPRPFAETISDTIQWFRDHHYL